MASGTPAPTFIYIESQTTKGIDWTRWTVIGCLLWLVLAFLAGSSAVAFILIPVAGPILGWLLGLLVYLVGGRFGRREAG
jgi:predicted PurR-regulated permease PerM